MELQLEEILIMIILPLIILIIAVALIFRAKQKIKFESRLSNVEKGLDNL